LGWTTTGPFLLAGIVFLVGAGGSTRDSFGQSYSPTRLSTKKQDRKLIHSKNPKQPSAVINTNCMVVKRGYIAILLLCLYILPAVIHSLPSIPFRNNNVNSSSMATTTTTATVMRRVGKLDPQRTALLLCDVQERFRSLIYHGETVIHTCRYMTSVARALNVPILITQQYSKVFGPTITDCFAYHHLQSEDGGAAIEDLLPTIPVFEKKQFSMITADVAAKLDEWDKTSYLIVGIEAHVCVQQTILDLLEWGKEVHVIVDGVSSQQPFDRSVALERVRQAGAYLTTAQSAAFMLLGSADHPQFKTVSKLTVEHMKLPNEFNA
jgi:nicotinamidase-related amidase